MCESGASGCQVMVMRRRHVKFVDLIEKLPVCHQAVDCLCVLNVCVFMNEVTQDRLCLVLHSTGFSFQSLAAYLFSFSVQGRP